MPALLRADDATLLRGASWDALLREALEEVAVAPPIEGWGEMHRPRFAHPLSALFPEAAPLLDPPAAALAGDGDTVQANGLVAPSGASAAYGALARYAFDVGEWENSRWSVFLGASGHPGSPHYADQHAMWAECRMAPMVCDWAALETDTEARQTLRP